MLVHITKVGKPFTSKKNNKVYIMCDTIDPETGETSKLFLTPDIFEKFFGKELNLVDSVELACARLDIEYGKRGFIEDIKSVE